MIQFLSALEGKSDDARIGARSNHKIVLQLPLVAVVQEIDAWIDTVICNLPIGRDIRSPLGRIVAKEIVNRTWQLFHTSDTRNSVRTEQLHTQHIFHRGCLLRRAAGLWRKRLAQAEHRLLGREK